VNKPVRKIEFLPQVTFMITAHNEDKKIEEKLINTLTLNYPKEKLQILVASDCSTDRTNDIVKKYRHKGVELLEVKERKGKEYAQKEAIKLSKGDIIVFSDVGTILETDGIKEIVFNFADPLVGCVSSEDKIIKKEGETSGEGIYVRYEMWLRRLESRVNSLVGLSGSFFAARKTVCYDFCGDSDFTTVLNSVRMRLRGISDADSIGYYCDLSEEKQEFNRKVRTVLRGLMVFFNHLEFLNVFKYGLFTYQYVCHKLLRWIVPFFMIIALFANLVLAFTSTFYLITYLIQIVFYVTGFYSWSKHSQVKNKILKVPRYFILVNTAIVIAWIKFIRGHRVITWTPSER
jgi:glycosyltransferase involved in cell wall biosynthesis